MSILNLNITVMEDKWNYKYVLCDFCDSKLKLERKQIPYKNTAGVFRYVMACPCCNQPLSIGKDSIDTKREEENR